MNNIQNIQRFGRYHSDAKEYRKNGHARTGRIQGDCILIDGVAHPYYAATDVACYDGSYVYAEKSTGDLWVVVGA